MEYMERTYRKLHRQQDLVHFQAVVKETDLDVAVLRTRFNDHLVKWVENLVMEYRCPLEQYIQRHPEFAKTLKPLSPLDGAPAMAVEMAEAAKLAGTGPMAAVAGAFAQYVGKRLLGRSREVIIENGGDIYMRCTKKRKIGIFAGQSPFSNKIALEIPPEQSPLGICTSSGTVGHALSFGTADAVVVLSPSAILADAVATASANMVKDVEDLQKAVDFATSIKGITGALAIKDDKMAVKGQVRIAPL
ncbi:UPF0280 family protein [Desulfofalx alkaliphila]|uniref:UPF0280 family protein n=1 Tax=Desulfofalx alkaliphila TaxID=105483 RepID=UPI0004E15E4C|nr:UPF0280 family protein [Desulfofalx alkaliphila]